MSTGLQEVIGDSPCVTVGITFWTDSIVDLKDEFAEACTDSWFDKDDLKRLFSILGSSVISTYKLRFQVDRKDGYCMYKDAGQCADASLPVVEVTITFPSALKGVNELPADVTRQILATIDDHWKNKCHVVPLKI